MICPKCGTSNVDAANVCMNCGEILYNYQPANNAQFSEPVQQPVQTAQPMQTAQPVYQQNLYQQPIPENYSETVSVGEWVGTTLLLMIPLVNLILIFVWAFGGGTKKSKSNYFKAYLLIMLILIGVSVVVGLLVGLLGVSMF